MSSPHRIRIGLVPEHFSLPIAQGIEHGTFAKHNIEPELFEHPRGTGSMCRALRNGENDIVIALTEGVINDIVHNGPGFKIIATYTDSPLSWAVVVSPLTNPNASSTAPSETPSPSIQSIADLRGKTFGISRFGSGSHLMACVMAEQHRWALHPPASPTSAGSASVDYGDIKFVAKGGLDDLVAGVADGSTDAFLWETVMLKPFTEKAVLRKVGQVVAPWPAFVIAARTEFLKTAPASVVQSLLAALVEATTSFGAEGAKTLDYISEKLPAIGRDGAEQWFAGVEFSKDGAVSRKLLRDTVKALAKSGLLPAGVGEDGADVDVDSLVDATVGKVVA